jgi:hypothetical protein
MVTCELRTFYGPFLQMVSRGVWKISMGVVVVLVVIDLDDIAESLCDCRVIPPHYYMSKLSIKPNKQGFIIA